MKTQYNKLNFNKESVTELNDQILTEIGGGTSHFCVMSSVTISIYFFTK